MAGFLRDFGLISTTIWHSEKFLALESHEARLAYMWLHTSHKTCAGVLRIGAAHIAEELDFIGGIEGAQAALEDMETVGLIKRLRPFVVITQFVRFNPVRQYKHAIGAWSEWSALPNSELKQGLFKELKAEKGSEALVAWRNKMDEPHKLLFEINEFAVLHLSEEAALGPLEDPSKTLGRPLADHRVEVEIEKKKENGEHSTVSKSSWPGTQKESGEMAENRATKLEGPRPETIDAVRRMEGR